jgi:hypothetical protein
MIGTITSNQGPPLLKIFNRTRYDTVGLTTALADYLTLTSTKPKPFDTDGWPFHFVLDEWNSSPVSGPVDVCHITSKVTLVRLLKPAKADKRKNVVDQISDLEQHRALPEVVDGFLKDVSCRLGLTINTKLDFAASIKVCPAIVEPDMTAIRALMTEEFVRLVDSNAARMNGNANTISRRLSSKAGWSKHLGFDVKQEILKSAPPYVQVWLEKLTDDRRGSHQEKNYEIVEKEPEEKLPKKLLFRAEFS